MVIDDRKKLTLLDNSLISGIERRLLLSRRDRNPRCMTKLA